ncbi:unnamed protein product, partial [Rotaria socialis]
IADTNEDVVSELTIGPAFQGNLTKILRARKKCHHSQTSDMSPNKTSEKPKVPSPPPSSSNYSPSLTSNNPLMKEINDWKL